jgi:uncharacterized protein (DUF1800 family)
MVPDADTDSFHQTYDGYEFSVGENSPDSLAAWWLRRMLDTPHPLLERLTLFWHDHFAVSRAKVGSLKLMATHVQRLRKFALGDYRELLAAVIQDPATYLTLESSQNRKSAPNSSPARQLLEQYTIGPDLTSDLDVKEAARAFTGWFVRTERLRFVPREHDNGTKSFLGRSGKWNANDILDILFEQPALAQMVVRKLYRHFISETEPAPEALIDALAHSFAKDFHIGRLVRTMLGSNLFFSKWAYRRRIKSPVEYALGIVLAMEARVPTLPLSHDIKRLGQELYNPPTRMGWSGGLAWLSPSTLIQRANLASDLLASAGRYGGRIEPARMVDGNETTELKRLSDAFLQGDLDKRVADEIEKAVAVAAKERSQQLRQLAYSLVTLPEFQLA